LSISSQSVVPRQLKATCKEGLQKSQHQCRLNFTQKKEVLLTLCRLIGRQAAATTTTTTAIKAQ
jgi:hypothetical protein